jgi:hypothetical protein
MWVSYATLLNNIVFEDCVFNELTVSSTSSWVDATCFSFQGVIFRNCYIGSTGSVYGVVGFYGNRGLIYSEHHNQVENDHRYYIIDSWIRSSDNIHYAPMSMNKNLYIIAASLQLAIPEQANGGARFSKSFSFRGERGSSYRVGCWILKNATYGTSSLFNPIFRIGRFTGTFPNARWVETDVTTGNAHSVWHWVEQTIEVEADSPIKITIVATSSGRGIGQTVLIDGLGAQKIS